MTFAYGSHTGRLATAALCTLALAACGGGSGGGGGSTTSGTEVTGTVHFPDGSTPVSGGTVYVPDSGGSSGGVISAAGTVARMAGAETTCPEPAESYVAYTCTNEDGTFTLDAGASSGSVTVKVVKGAFNLEKTVDLDQTTDLGDTSLPADTSKGAPNIAVVTGSFDSMEDILAKLGMGTLNGQNRLKKGSETFDLYDGNYSLSDSSYPNFPALFTDGDGDGKKDIHNYDVVFINCGNLYESSHLTKGNADYAVPAIRDYVKNGGVLYVTDQAYDYVEQAFPAYIDFQGSPNTAASDPEAINAGQAGLAGITPDGTVKDAPLKTWLGGVGCDGGNCLNSDGTLPLAGFASAWAVIKQAHSGKSSDVAFWVEADVDWYSGSGVRPLTASFEVGDGKVIYSSYHTEHSNPVAGFHPQERVLQYLVLETN
jgi:hypothetical protein